MTSCLGLLKNCHRASCLRPLAKALNVGSLVLPGTAFRNLASLPSSGGQYFGEAGGVCVWVTGAGRITVWGLENLNSRNNLCNSCGIEIAREEERGGCPVSHPPPQVVLFLSYK